MFSCYENSFGVKIHITNVSSTVQIKENLNEFSKKEIFNKVKKGIISILNITEWKFTSFTPDLNISFDKNLAKNMNYKLIEYDDDQLNLKRIELASLINKYKFPVQVIYYPDK